MSNLATLIQTKSVRKNEIRDEIGNLMSCLFTASLLVYAVRHQDIQNIDCIEALAKHLTLNVHESEIEALKEKSGFLRTIVSRSKDFDEFDRSQKGCFEKAFDSSDNDGWMVTDVSDELYDIIRCLVSDLSVSHSRKLTVEGLIVDLLQSDVSKEPWASIDHPGVFTKAQVDEEILLRLVSNRYGSSGKNMGVRCNMFEVFDNFPNGLLPKNKPMNEAIFDGLPTTLKDFMNEKDD